MTGVLVIRSFGQTKQTRVKIEGMSTRRAGEREEEKRMDGPMEKCGWTDGWFDLKAVTQVSHDLMDAWQKFRI